MSSQRFVGTQIHLTIQTKFLTFTPDLFNQAMKEKGFMMSNTQTIHPQTGQPISLQTFSKGNLIIFLSPPTLPQQPPPISFRIINTINLTKNTGGISLIESIKDILVNLNIVPEVIAMITFYCNTMVSTEKEPMKILTSTLNTDILSNIESAFGDEKIQVLSIKLGTSFLLEKNGLQIIIEPLGTNPTRQYYMNILFQTTEEHAFDEFIRQFGEDTIQRIVGALAKNV